MVDLTTEYGKLMNKYKEQVIFSSGVSVLNWDMLTKMPPNGINLRSEQLALLGGIGHRMAADPEIGKLLDNIKQHPDFNSMDYIQKRNINLISKIYAETVALPEELVVEMQRQTSIAQDVWRRAKAANDWTMFLPELKKNFELTKRTADIFMKVKKTDTPYDALLDIYEPGITADHISGLFNELRIGLIILLDKIKHSPQQPDLSILDRKIPAGVQRTIALALAKAIGYDVVSSNAGGRIDDTEHPFTSGYYSDVRITTHYHEDRFTSSVFSVLHEAGHALYEQFQNPEWIYQPVGSACSTGFHESQSRMIENMIGKSYEFWNCFLPELQVIAGDSLKDIELKKYVHAINHVQPSMIRIEADEVTYSLHVIIRFNLEKALFENKISVEEMPEFWNKSYHDYLGIDIPNYSEGILQDVHWAGGMFGYFPCYALGNIYSGQLLAQMNLDIPQWPEELRKGNFTPVKNWMTDKIHRQGDLYDPPVLIKRITGQELTVKPFINYLNRKYSGLYGL